MKLLLYSLLLLAPAALANQATEDADFLAAHDAYRAGNADQLIHYAQRLHASPMEVYVDYYRLSLALKKIGPQPIPDSLAGAIQTFLARPEDTPVIDLLRGEWLRVLGEKQQWTLFDAAYPHLRNGDNELACYALQSRRRNDNTGALADARKLWFTDESQPGACGELFDAALSAGIITDQDISQRLRLALEGNNVTLAAALSGRLDSQYAALPAMLHSAAANPDRYLEQLVEALPNPDTAQHDLKYAMQDDVQTGRADQPPSTDLQSYLPGTDKPGPAKPARWFEWDAILSRLGMGKPGDSVSDVIESELARLKGNSKPACKAPCTGKEEAEPPLGWIAQLASKGQRIAAMFAVERLAKQSPDLAAERWSRIAGHFPPGEQHYCYGRLAYQAARNLDPRALGWYEEAADTALSEPQSAWRVRAALRAGNWQEVLAGVNAMDDTQRQESAWLYWKARALQALGKTADAREIFAPLSGEYSFYGQLAGAELADSPVMSQTVADYKPDQQAIDRVSAMPGVQRTVTLYRIGLRSDALEEWRWVVNNLSDRELLTAAEIARRNKMYDRAIGAAEKTVNEHDFSMRYLAPYRDDLQSHIQQHGLDEAWVYGLMRQESRFATSAKSGSGAAGLMQIMPATARWVANKLGLKSYRKALIHQLDTNLRIGTYYMKSVLSRAENNPVLASAAYNAGPTRALQWRADKPLEGAIYAETIPYAETRDYVEKVMSNTVYYAEQFGDPPRSLKQRLGMVPAKPGDDTTDQSAAADVR